MTNKEVQMEKWAAEIVIDEMMANSFKKIDDCPYYHAYAELFKKWHKEFEEGAWSNYIQKQLEELV